VIFLGIIMSILSALILPGLFIHSGTAGWFGVLFVVACLIYAMEGWLALDREWLSKRIQKAVDKQIAIDEKNRSHNVTRKEQS